MSNARRVFAVVLTLGALAGGAGHLAAQACIGNGALDAQGFLIGHAGFTDGAWAPGGTLGYNAAGPVTVSAGATHTMFDNTDVATTSVGAGVAVEIPEIPVSLCPTLSGSYQWLSNEGELEGSGIDLDGFLVSGGLALGGRVESDRSNFAFIPQVSANLVHDRASLSAGGESVTGSETFGSFAGSATLAFGNVFFGPSASISTLDEADPVFGAHLGVAF